MSSLMTLQGFHDYLGDGELPLNKWDRYIEQISEFAARDGETVFYRIAFLLRNQTDADEQVLRRNQVVAEIITMLPARPAEVVQLDENEVEALLTTYEQNAPQILAEALRQGEGTPSQVAKMSEALLALNVPPATVNALIETNNDIKTQAGAAPVPVAATSTGVVNTQTGAPADTAAKVSPLVLIGGAALAFLALKG